MGEDSGQIEGAKATGTEAGQIDARRINREGCQDLIQNSDYRIGCSPLQLTDGEFAVAPEDGGDLQSFWRRRVNHL